MKFFTTIVKEGTDAQFDAVYIKNLTASRFIPALWPRQFANPPINLYTVSVPLLFTIWFVMTDELPGFDFSGLPVGVQKIIGIFRKHDINFWLAGGYVRDWLAHTPSKDVDIVAEADKWTIERLIHGKIINCRHTIVISGDVQISPIERGAFNLDNRDYTANAIAIDSKGNIVDPWNGVEDIKHRQFRAFSRESLEADPIRMIRGCRLAARLGWKLEDQTAAWIRQLAKTLDLHADRVIRTRLGLELHKAFGDPRPSKFFEMVYRQDLLKQLFPQLEKLLEKSPVAARKRLAACDRVPPGNSQMRMAMLLGDIEPGNANNSAAIARKYLRMINWDLTASNFHEEKNYYRKNIMAAAIRFRRTNFNTKKVLNKVIEFAQETNGFNFVEMLHARQAFFGDECNDFQIAAALDYFRKIGNDKHLSRGKRRVALVLSGLSREEAVRIVRPSEDCAPPKALPTGKG